MNHYFKYVMDHFERLYGPARHMLDYQGKNPEAKVKLTDCQTTLFEEKRRIPESICWKDFEGTRLPFLFHEFTESPIIEAKGESIQVSYDLVAASFYFLSQWQEYHGTEKDHYGRFPYETSIQKELGIETLPVVNYYFLILKRAIEQAYGADALSKKPTEPVLFVSHDIDKVATGWKEDGFNALKKGRLPALFQLALGKLIGKDTWFNFDRILKLEKSLGVKSTFFFLVEQGQRDGISNADYTLEQKAFAPVFQHIQQNGAEVALHGSIGSAYDSAMMKNELHQFDPFGVQIKGNRFHFLNFHLQSSLRVVEESGVRYDCSVGFAEHIGFRNSFCHPYYPFNFEEQKAHSFLEIPLNIMDTTFDQSGYMGLDKELVVKTCEPLIEEVAKFGGCLSVLWHNNYFSDHKYEGWEKVFSDLINRCKDIGLISKSAIELVEELEAE
ncbi:polysaccharide deacetylase family protein [bacterium SCSIO 12741]|nr:polysaccharide deacetylase family protein [bacterium SCSIO 12741]